MWPLEFSTQFPPESSQPDKIPQFERSPGWLRQTSETERFVFIRGLVKKRIEDLNLRDATLTFQ